MRFRARDVAAATSGTLIGPDVSIDGASFDSRSIRAGQLFVPIIDQRDGHDFIEAAVDRGAPCYLSARADPSVRRASAIIVDDTLEAFMRLARVQRVVLPATVIGITGSVGKTSTKDFAAAALAASRRTCASERSFNNDQGVPSTILNAPDDTEVLVLEMGMRGFGEIARLCTVAAPTIGVVTRVAEAHSDRVGGIDGVARAKAELVSALPVHGVAILNGDDPRVLAMASVGSGSVLTFGSGLHCDVRIERLAIDPAAHASFRLATPWGEVGVTLGVAGRHMAWNAAAAVACVGAVGGDVTAGAAALGRVRVTSMRMDVQVAVGGALVLDDSYNANPTSMRAALDALADLAAERRFAVLGVMAEISDPAAEHAAITRYAERLGIVLIAVGTAAYGVAPEADPLVALGTLGEGDAVLVKGSRVAALDRVAAALRER